MCQVRRVFVSNRQQIQMHLKVVYLNRCFNYSEHSRDGVDKRMDDVREVSRVVKGDLGH